MRGGKGTALILLLTAVMMLDGCEKSVTLIPPNVNVDGISYPVIDSTADTSDEMVDPNSKISLKYGVVDALRAANAYPAYRNDAIPTSYLDAARIAIPILNGALGTWTETGAAVVGINFYADVWLVTGQYWSRESDFGPLGVCLLARETGQVIYVGFGLPQ